MRRLVGLFLGVVMLLSCVSFASAERYTLSRDEYQTFYEVAEYLCEDWDTPLWELLDDIAWEYGTTADELYEFMEFAVFCDSDHVWLPVYGGQKYHASPDCSKMIEPRPATKEMAKDFGFKPCGRCKPGK